jgi:hypothetical protein
MTTDQPRPAAASRDEYSLTIDDAAALYERAGHPRIVRTLQRYCAKGHLDCIRQETQFGDRFLVTPASVARHIAQIAELASASRRDEPRPAAAEAAPEPSHNADDDHAASDPGQPRPAAASTDLPIFNHPYVRRLEAEVDDLKSKYEKQVRRTEDILEDANKRLVEMAQAGQIAGSKTLAEYLLAANNPPPASVDHRDATS